MAHKAPPVPPAQRSDKIRGASSPADRDPETARDPAGGNAHLNLDQQGRHGGVAQNTRHQGYQQDR